MKRRHASVIAIAVAAMVGVPGWASAADGPVTFSKDVAPILQEKCQSCHSPGSIGPMSLRTFRESRPWARAIRDRVRARQMPPWHIERGVGVQKFKNDMSLTDEQITTIVKWVEQGAAEGNPADMPPLKPVPTTLYWEAEVEGYGPPDIVVKTPYRTMPATTQDQWWRPLVDISGLDEPRWIRMTEIRPGNLEGRRVLHHSNAYFVINEANLDAVNTGLVSGRGRSANDAGDLMNERPMLSEWGIGKGYDRYPDGVGKLIFPGEKISWSQHVHAVGEEVTTGTELGIWLYPKGQEPKHRLHTLNFAGQRRGGAGLDIPPNSLVYSSGFTVLKENAVITSFQPHLHIRGKSMKVEAILPDGRTDVISYVENYDFKWMTNYIYADDVAPVYPKGTVIHVSSMFDNTSANPNNPDPNQWVGSGDRTVDEMTHAWMGVYYLSNEEYQQKLAERRQVSTQDQ